MRDRLAPHPHRQGSAPSRGPRKQRDGPLLAAFCAHSGLTRAIRVMQNDGEQSFRETLQPQP
jgi:hypothetical protein